LIDWRQIFFFLSFLLTVGGFNAGAIQAQQDATLLSVVKQDEVNLSRFVLQFSRLPEYQIKTSGQRLEVDLMDIEMSSAAVLPAPDERLVQILVGKAKGKLVLSFLLRRPPYFVNGVKDDRYNRISIDVHWQAGQKGTRPAISRKLPGQMSIDNDGGVVSRAIASKYRGNWLAFYADYEPPVHLVVPVKYTVAPFPCLALFEQEGDFLPLEVLSLAQRGEWPSAFSALDHVGLESADGGDQFRLLLIRADIQYRAGKIAAAQRYLDQALDQLDELTDGNEQLTECLRLQQAYVDSATSATPYEFLAEIDEQEQITSPAAQRYFDLLNVEVAIAVGDYQRCRALLDTCLLHDPGDLEPFYRLRSADLVFLRGDLAGAVEQYAALADVLMAGESEVRAPFSLANYALALYRTQQYADAIERLKQLLPALNDGEERDMARYIMALAMIHSGDMDGGYDLLHQIAAGTVGASLSKGKIADFGMQSNDIYSRRRSLQEYAELSEQFLDREWRAEMQFKHALALHIMGRDLSSIKELERFLRNDHLTKLRAHAQALLAEVLPVVIHDLVAREKYFEALVLVEQNRDLLVATSRNFDFLVELGQVFTKLNYADSAQRLYTYLLDVNDVGERQEQVFAPLLNSLLQQENYDRVLSYAKRYFNDYPQGKNRSAVFFLQLRALLAQGNEDEVIRELQKKKHPESVAINRLAANLAWKHKLVPMAQQNIDAVVGDDFTNAAPADQLLQAEILLYQGEMSAALKRYRNLSTIPGFVDQASYRAATILLRQGQRKQGLKLLQKLVDMDKESQWRSLAQETLSIERFDR